MRKPVKDFLIILTLIAPVLILFLWIKQIGDQRYNALLIDHSSLEKQRQVLIQRLGDLEAATENVSMPEYFSIHAADRVAAQLELQQAVLDLAAGRELQLISFGPSASAGDPSAPQIAFEIEGEASFANAVSFLIDLEMAEPMLGTRSLQVRQLALSSRPEVSVPVSLRVLVWSFWRASDESPQ